MYSRRAEPSLGSLSTLETELPLQLSLARDPPRGVSVWFLALDRKTYSVICVVVICAESSVTVSNVVVVSGCSGSVARARAEALRGSPSTNTAEGRPSKPSGASQ